MFDENRSEMEAKHEAEEKSRLDQAVKDGKITQEQEDKIIAKLKEMKANREANKDDLKDKTEAERKAAMEAKRQSLSRGLSKITSRLNIFTLVEIVDMEDHHNNNILTPPRDKKYFCDE